jgi:hypothetical protein
MRTLRELLYVVKQYALENYNADGWDYVVECWSDEDIEEAIITAKTPPRSNYSSS